MEILKKLFFVIFITGQLNHAFAQQDAALQKAFSESYTLEASGKYAEAASLLEKQNGASNYEIQLRLGWLHYMNKNYTVSQSHYEKAVKAKPYSIEAKLGLIKPLSALESWDKVLQEYEDILKIDPQHYTANYWAGVIQYNRKKYDLAIRHFEKVVNLYPFDYDGNHMLGWSCFQAGRFNDAKLLFNKALLNRPADASCIEGLSKIK
jgi:tetratricopeptide (TPR) repeat protein